MKDLGINKPFAGNNFFTSAPSCEHQWILHIYCLECWQNFQPQHTCNRCDWDGSNISLSLPFRQVAIMSLQVPSPLVEIHCLVVCSKKKKDNKACYSNQHIGLTNIQPFKEICICSMTDLYGIWKFSIDHKRKSFKVYLFEILKALHWTCYSINFFFDYGKYSEFIARCVHMVLLVTVTTSPYLWAWCDISGCKYTTAVTMNTMWCIMWLWPLLLCQQCDAVMSLWLP